MSENKEIRTFFGRCRCCLNYGYLKYMWAKYFSKGEVEIYGEMLVQCFALSIEQSGDVSEVDHICETCIIKLRDASSFKKTVLEAQEELSKLLDEEHKTIVKMEDVSENSDAEQSLMADSQSGADSQDTYAAEQDPGEGTADDSQADEPTEQEYEEVEFLEDELKEDASEDAKELVVQVPMEAGVSQSGADEKPPEKRKWPKRLPKDQRYKTYKQYTSEDLRKCMEAVSNKKMTSLEASELYNIPKKTVEAKARDYKKIKIENRDPNKEKTYNFIQEIKTILTYTNATPFKSKANRYYCAYCSTDSPLFEDPNELRTHTRTVHADDRTTKIEFSLRPHWLNEVVKIDIDNLLCNVCCTAITSWNEMFKHLKRQHNVVLDQAYTRLIPYVLNDQLKCALCKATFTNYMILDAHMNAHYENYICDDCGDTFISLYRLRQHTKIHNVGQYPCRHCSKVFALEKYRKKHEELVHEHKSTFKCSYCPRKCSSEYLRHLHVVEEHNEKINIITCELCGKTFNWRPYFLGHMRKRHSGKNKNKKLACEQCGKTFYKSHKLSEHMTTHSGEKNFSCDICNKSFMSLAAMKTHVKCHTKEIVNAIVVKDNDAGVIK